MRAAEKEKCHMTGPREKKGENKERESETEEIEQVSSTELFVFTERKGQTL